MEKINKKRGSLFATYIRNFIAIGLATLIVIGQLRLTSTQARFERNFMTFSPPNVVTKEYYVSAGPGASDSNSGESPSDPFATLAKAADAINSRPINLDGSGFYNTEHYYVYVMTDLVSDTCARFYGHNVTIKSYGTNTYTVSRAASFNTMSDPARGAFNPAMIEIGNTTYLHTLKIFLTLENIVFDDLGLKPAGTNYGWQAEGVGIASTVNLPLCQDGIVSSYDGATTIVLANGATLKNYGGMSAVRLKYGSSLIMESGSLITDTMITTERGLGNISNPGQYNYQAYGEAAVSMATGDTNIGSIKMENGARITNIVNNHGISAKGKVALYIDGEITGLRGFACFGDSSNWQYGRGMKNALYIEGTTYDYESKNLGSAIIGPNGNLHGNSIKSGTVYITGGNASLVVYGKINNNTALVGVASAGGVLTTTAGTNGGGLYIISGAKVYLEAGSEIKNNTVTNSAYGGGVSVQQGNSSLIMNGGTIANNVATYGRDIAINKGGASFTMNGGTISNTVAESVVLVGDGSQTNGKIVINNGNLSFLTTATNRSGTSVYQLNNTSFANINERHIAISADFDLANISSGYVRVSNPGDYSSALLPPATANVPIRNVILKTNGLKIGSPNPAAYTYIRTVLPKGWHLPSQTNNVYALWAQKNGIMEFQINAIPTVAGTTSPSSYRGGVPNYFVAVVATNANGTIVAGAPVKYYPVATTVSGTQVNASFTVPMNAYPNGATIVLLQGTNIYGELEFEAPAILNYNLTATSYNIAYSASYEMPDGLILEMVTNDLGNPVTTKLYIQADYRTEIAPASLTNFQSDIFSVIGLPVWNSVTGELEVTLELKTSWDSAVNKETTFDFIATMDASHFVPGDELILGGNIVIEDSNSSSIYLVPGNFVRTLMDVQYGSLVIKNTVAGDAADPNKEFHFIINFDDSRVFGGYSTGDVITLKGGESITIYDIIVGVGYTIVEVEANTDGYITTSSGASGIISSELSIADFLNSRNMRINTGDTDMTLIYGAMALAGLAIILVIVSSKRKGKTKK